MVPIVEALVRADGSDIAYLRAGCGPPLVVLCVPPEAAPRGAGGGGSDRDRDAAHAIAAHLAPRFRVIVPLAAPPRGAAGGRWLRGLIDGLGLERPTLVAGASLAPLLLRVIDRDPDRVGAVVVVPAASAAEAWLPPAIDTLPGVRVRV